MIKRLPQPLSRRCVLLRSSPVARSPPTRRFISTQSPPSPADKPRSWRNTAVRWGLAGALLYYYNTAANLTAFAEEPEYLAPRPFIAIANEAERPLTLDAIAEQKRKAHASILASATDQTEKNQDAAESQSAPKSSDAAQEEVKGDAEMGEAEEEDPQAGAFNPETGEINWDCPCLGGMAHGTCGEQFKAAFSCFVFSTDEPKGMDCIDKFKGMQDCFREHPEEYGDELAEDEEEAEDDELVEGSVALEKGSDHPTSQSLTSNSDTKPLQEPVKATTKSEPILSKSESGTDGATTK